MEVTAQRKPLSFTNKILIGTVLGIVVGYIFGERIEDLRVIGDIFLRLIQMAVPVLIFGAVTEAMGSLDPKALRKMGVRMFAWFIISTSIAAAAGLTFAFITNPGTGIPQGLLQSNIEPPAAQTPVQLILGFFGTNIVDSMARGSMIQIIIFALLFGVAVCFVTKETGNTLLIDYLRIFNQALLRMVKIVMHIAPLGVFALMSWVAGKLGFGVILPLAKYLGGIALACLLFMITIISIVAAYVRVNPIKLASKLVNMSLVASATTSSAISLPIKMQDSVEKLGVSKRISGLVNPIGMVLNSPGQAMFLSMASVMLSQFFNLDMSFGRIVQIVVVSTLACMGTLAVPGGALVILAGLLPSLGIPIEGIALIAGVDWFRGMITTIPNVACDAMISLVIAKDEGEFYREVFDGELTAAEAAKKLINQP